MPAAVISNLVDSFRAFPASNYDMPLSFAGLPLVHGGMA
jgi:hypothetical protein